MQELIKVNEETNTVLASDLYNYLELSKSQFARWCKDNILNNPFAEQGKEFSTCKSNATEQGIGGYTKKDYNLSVDFAKKLCMLTKSKKAEEVRDYFIEVEKRFNNVKENYKEIFDNMSDIEKQRFERRYQLAKERIHLTNAIKIFVEYATNQGSKNAHFYYANFTKLININLFKIKNAAKFKSINGKGVRDFLDLVQLSNLSSTEDYIQRELLKLMACKCDYKIIYKTITDEVKRLFEFYNIDIPHLMSVEEIENSRPVIVDEFYNEYILSKIKQDSNFKITMEENINE